MMDLFPPLRGPCDGDADGDGQIKFLSLFGPSGNQIRSDSVGKLSLEACGKGVMLVFLHTNIYIFNRPGVAMAVLQLALLLINSVSDGLWKYLYGAAMPQQLEMGLSVIK